MVAGLAFAPRKCDSKCCKFKARIGSNSEQLHKIQVEAGTNTMAEQSWSFQPGPLLPKRAWRAVHGFHLLGLVGCCWFVGPCVRYQPPPAKMGRLGIFSSSCGSILARRIPTSAFTSPGHRVHRAHATTTHVPIACEQSGVRSNKMSSTAGSEADPWNRETKQKFEG